MQTMQEFARAVLPFVPYSMVAFGLAMVKSSATRKQGTIGKVIVTVGGLFVVGHLVSRFIQM